MFKYWCRRYKYAVIFYVLILIYSGYSIGKVYGFTIFPDEFGYWTYAARAAGYDWSDIASLGSYYSYGYSLVLFPIFKIFTDAVVAYRVVLIINFALLGVSYLIIAWLGRNLLKLGHNESYMAATVAVLYPGVLFYADTTMVETMLAVMYIVICMLMYSYVENNRPGTLVLLVISLVYMHFLHMRTVGILIAGILSILAYKAIDGNRLNKLKNHIVTLAIFILVIAMGLMLKDKLQEIIFTQSDVSTNDYSGQLWKIRYLFTKDGMIDFAESLVGKLFYMGLSTYGLAWFGIAGIVKNIVRQDNMKPKVTHIFILLSTSGELLINAIYTIHPGRVDTVIYGRYHEFVFPILILYGVCELGNAVVNITGVLIKTSLIIISEFVMALIAIHSIVRYGITIFQGCFVSGVLLLYDIDNFTPEEFIWGAYISGIVLTMAVVALAVLSTRLKGKWNILIMGLAVIEIVYALRASYLTTFRVTIGTYRDITIASKILELRKEDDTRRIVYVPTNGTHRIGILQFYMRDEDIEILPARESLSDYNNEEIDKNDILILYYSDNRKAEAKDLYNCGLLDGHFYIYYNK